MAERPPLQKALQEGAGRIQPDPWWTLSRSASPRPTEQQDEQEHRTSEQLQMSSALTHKAKNGYHVGFPTSPSQTEGDRKLPILPSADPPGACTPHSQRPPNTPRNPLSYECVLFLAGGPA